MNNIGLVVIKGNTAQDMSELVSNVKWAGRKGAASRSLSVTFLDDDGYGHTRPEIDIEEGHQCIYYWKGKELFRGMFMKQEQSTSKVFPAMAYDTGIYLANNSDTFNYSGKKASEIFIDVCNRFEIPYGDVADTSYQIPELPKPKTTGWDVICDALSLTYKAAGIRYYPLCVGEKMSLLERRQNILQWVVETGVNLENYKLTKSIENIRTRIKLLSKEDAVLAEAVDATLEKKIGIFQDISSVNDEMNKTELTELVNSMLEEKSKPDRSLTITALGLDEVTTGVGVFIIIKELSISKTFYVEEDTHMFQGNYHSMKLKLVEATDIESKKPDENPEAIADIKIGDTVQFSGGYHYISSTASSPTGGSRTAGPAKCTLIAKGKPHPYHLIGSSSNVYGWVDADKVTK